MNNEVDVSIIFVNYKAKDLTVNAINSVIEKTEGLVYEIFVVDNASNDGSIEAIEQQFNGIEVTNPSPQSFPTNGEVAPVYIIKSDINGGFGYANNLAIRQANGKYILCLNTDTLLINNAIKIMFDFMEKNENKTVCACGGNLLTIKKELLNQCFIFPKLFKYNIKASPELLLSKKPIDVDWVSGADLFLRKSVLDVVGIFDEEFFMYCEETDLCKRIKSKGYKIYFLPNAKIIHLIGGSTNIDSLNLNKVKYSAHSVYHYYSKHFGRIYTIIPRFYYIYKYLKRFIINKNISELKALIITQIS